MKTSIVFESEYRFCLLLWENEPIKSTDLVRLCRSKLNWSKSTTYTVIRRLSERGIIVNNDTIVHSVKSKDQVQDILLKDFIETYFNGSFSEISVALSRVRK